MDKTAHLIELKLINTEKPKCPKCNGEAKIDIENKIVKCCRCKQNYRIWTIFSDKKDIIVYEEE